jgi:hypothetical protein
MFNSVAQHLFNHVTGCAALNTACMMQVQLLLTSSARQL